MKVYLAGEKQRRQKTFIMSVAPAATVRDQEIPAHWLEGKDNLPKQFNVEFSYGEAEVEDDIGRYLLEAGVARRTKLHLPRDEPTDEYDPALVTG